MGRFKASNTVFSSGVINVENLGIIVSSTTESTYFDNDMCVIPKLFF